jgi:hypothetical protein
MNGMEMMLKNMLGIDPAVLRQKLEEGMNLLKTTLTHFDSRMAELEKRNEALCSKVDELILEIKNNGTHSQNDKHKAKQQSGGNGAAKRIGNSSERPAITAD